MFTIKFYSDDPNSANPYRQRILSAESFTILRTADGAEITLHQRNLSDDIRVDVHADDGKERESHRPAVYQRAIIENAAGKTTEIIGASGR